MTSGLNDSGVRKIASQSGFPLQFAVEHAISAGDHGWQPLVREHPWTSAAEARPKFIDLVLHHTRLDVLRAVVECKKQKVDKPLIFFVAEGCRPSCATAKAHWICKSARPAIGSGWFDFHYEPLSYESEFCVIPDGSKERPRLLEQWIHDLVESCSAIAEEAISFLDTDGLHVALMHIPVLVTTAPLFVLHYDPASIELATGALPENARIEPVPFIRFRKSLSDHYGGTTPPSTLQRSHRGKQRTVMVVSAESLDDFFNKLEPKEKKNSQLPWWPLVHDGPWLAP